MRAFGAVRSLDVRSLAGPVVEVQVRAGTELVREGAAIGAFFVIRSGIAQLTQGERHVGTLGSEDCFGEIDPLAPSPQPFAVTAISPMRLLTFSAFGISRLCEALPGTRERLIESLPGQAAEVHVLHPTPTRSLSQRRRIEHGDSAVVGGYPAELAHQAQRA
jgi:CRP-like cAMP-binding protein